MFRLFSGNTFKKVNGRFFIFLLFLFISISTNSQQKQVDVSTPISKQHAVITSKDSIESINSLIAELDAVLNNVVLNKSDFSVAIYSLDNKRYYYKKNIDKLLTPASTTKLFTTFSALMVLGTDFKVKTSIYTDARTIKNGVIDGNLYIVGRGDALFSSDDINWLVEAIAKKGIKKITGCIYADGSFFDDMTDRQKYSGDRDLVEAIPPITALSLDKNTVTITVSAGHTSGKHLNVSLSPTSEAFKVSNSATVKGIRVKSKRKKKSRSSSRPFNNNESIIQTLFQNKRYGDAPPEPVRKRTSSTIKFSSKLNKDGTQSFVLSGYLLANRTVSYKYYILNPSLAVAGALKNKLIAAGIQVNGKIEVKPLDITNVKIPKTLIVEFQRPLTDICGNANKESDNYIAENIFKLLGANAERSEDNAKSARETIKNLFMKLKIPFETCQLNDGSGLSRRNLVTTESIIMMLEKARQQMLGYVFDSTLSIAGFDGTLKTRMLGTRAECNLHGKTGTLNNTSALSGYVTTLDGEQLAFSFIFNGSYVYHFKETENELGKIIARYFYFNVEN